MIHAKTVKWKKQYALMMLCFFCVYLLIPEHVQAYMPLRKTKSFVIHNLGDADKLSVQVFGIDDVTKFQRPWDGGDNRTGSITWSYNGYTLSVWMNGVDVNSWTPYLQITTGKNYYRPTGWENVSYGTTGTERYYEEVHHLQDNWNNGSCLFYIGAGFAANEITAKWTPWEHTVVYDANGGNNAPASQTKTYGLLNYLSNQVPVRTGYTFLGWDCSLGGLYQPGAAYGYDQNGGTVVMRARWQDTIGATIQSVSATPQSWGNGKGTVEVTAVDQGSGIQKIILKRFSKISGKTLVVQEFLHSGENTACTDFYTEQEEGIYYYTADIYDVAGNVSSVSTNWIYLDHTAPLIGGVEKLTGEWTREAPEFAATATDFLSAGTEPGSGVSQIRLELLNEAGDFFTKDITNTSYTLEPQYEGIYQWSITATDAVGWETKQFFTTRYDCTPPQIEGTEVESVWTGEMMAGYCQDNIINQHITDDVSASINHPNACSGLKSALLYQVTDGEENLIRGKTTSVVHDTAEGMSAIDIYYDTSGDTNVDYYMLYAYDFAGNGVKKKLVTQKSLLRRIRTTIERSTFDKKGLKDK